MQSSCHVRLGGETDLGRTARGLVVPVVVILKPGESVSYLLDLERGLAVQLRELLLHIRRNQIFDDFWRLRWNDPWVEDSKSPTEAHRWFIETSPKGELAGDAGGDDRLRAGAVACTFDTMKGQGRLAHTTHEQSNLVVR